MKHPKENKIMDLRRTQWAALLACAMAPVAAWAETAVQLVTGAQQSNGEVIRIELSEPLADLPKGFAMQSPARIALDLPGVVNGTDRSLHELNLANVRSAVVAQSGERTRLVLNLRQFTTYRTEVQGKTLIVRIDPAQSASTSAPLPAPVAPVAVANVPGPAAAVTAPATRFADSRNRQSESLRGVDFRRGGDNAGRVVVNLPSNQVGVDIRQQGQSLVVDFLRSRLPESLRRKLDVADFGTPVQSVSTSQVGDHVRMVVTPKGDWEHSAYQTDDQFVLEVRPVKRDSQKLTGGPGFSGEKLTLNFQSIEVRSLLQVIADFTNFNIVTSDTVQGNVTLRLKDVPWDQALDIIMQAKSLGVRKTGNVLWVAPKDELAAKEKQELESQAALVALEPLRSQAFQLNYAKAEDVARAIGGGGSTGSAGGAGGASGGGRILSSRGSVFAEARTNQLFVNDVPGKLEEITQLLGKIDVPVRQVMIEARIVEAEDTWGRALGVKLGSSDLRGLNGGTTGWGVGGNNQVAIGGNYSSLGYQTLQTSTASALTDTQFVSLPANVSGSAFGGASAASFALSLFGAASNRFLNLELSALESDGRGKLISSPRVITADQKSALIEQGTELPYQSATSSGATAVSFRKANLKLEVTPQITPEGGIIMDVDVNKDSVGQSTSSGYAINTKHVKTQVLVENGGTVVIGGIFETSENESMNKVPLLGDIPVVGALFRNKVRSTSKTELLVFLTPKVITDRNAVSVR